MVGILEPPKDLMSFLHKAHVLWSMWRSITYGLIGVRLHCPERTASFWASVLPIPGRTAQREIWKSHRHSMQSTKGSPWLSKSPASHRASLLRCSGNFAHFQWCLSLVQMEDSGYEDTQGCTELESQCVCGGGVIFILLEAPQSLGGSS